MGISVWNRIKQAFRGIGRGEKWQKVWDARLAALEGILGKSADYVYHSPTPFYLGGDADVIIFPNYQSGVAYVTADLTGEFSGQPPNDIARYELMLCLHERADWAPYRLSRLSRYTLQAQLNPGETMDCPMSDESQIVALLFILPEPIYEFGVLGDPSILLLCIGITAEELKVVRRDGSQTVLKQLKESGVYLFTDLARSACL